MVNQLKRNIVFAKNYLSERKVSFTTNVAPGRDDFKKEIVLFAAEKGADLITIMNLQGSFMSGILGSSEQELITNEAQIPVMIVNPKDTGTGKGMGLFS